MGPQWVILFASLFCLSLTQTCTKFYPFTNTATSTNIGSVSGYFASPTNETVTLSDPSDPTCVASLSTQNQRAFNIGDDREDNPNNLQIPLTTNWAIRWQMVVNFPGAEVDCSENTGPDVGDGYAITLLNSVPLNPEQGNPHRAGFGSQTFTNGGGTSTGFGLTFDWKAACKGQEGRNTWGALRTNNYTANPLSTFSSAINPSELSANGTYNFLWKYTASSQTIDLYMNKEGDGTALYTNANQRMNYPQPDGQSFYATVFPANYQSLNGMNIIITTAGCSAFGLQLKNMEVSYGCSDSCASYGCEEWPNGANAYGSTCSSADLTTSVRTCTCQAGLGIQALLPSETIDGAAPISKCLDIDECAEWGCGANAFCSTSPDALNQRVCTCKPGYAISIDLTTTPWNISGREVVFGRGTWDKCNRGINLCSSPGCEAGSTCNQTSYNTRECTCGLGRSTTAVPAGSTLDARGNVPGAVVSLVSNAAAPSCSVDFDECNVDQFNCTGVDPARNGDGTCVSHGTAGIRQCNCPNPQIPFEQFFSGSDYKTPFPGCYNSQPCALYGCNGDANATCADTGANTRTCTCPIGFSPQTPSTLTGAEKFSGCVDIKECALWGCGGSYTVACREDRLNERTCYCPAGTTPNTTGLSSQTLVASDNATIQCDDIDECAVYGCPDIIGSIAGCTTLQTVAGLNWRSCQCDVSLTGSADLTGSNEFQGCSVPISISKSITLGFTLADGYWNDWGEVLILDVDNSGTLDFFAVTKQNHVVGWMESTNVQPNTPITWVSHFNLTKTGLVCNSPVDFIYNLADPIKNRSSFFCVNENGDLVVHILETSSPVLADPELLVEANPLIRNPTTYIAKVHASGRNFVLFDQGSLLVEFIKDVNDLGTDEYKTELVAIHYSDGLDITSGIEYPLWVDLDNDGQDDLVFVHTATGKFVWYKQAALNVSGMFMSYIGSFQPPGRTPAQFAIFDYNNDGRLDFVGLTSDCYAMYQVPSLGTTTGEINPEPKADGACPTCGCGFASGIIAADMNQDSMPDLIISISGGALVAINENNGDFKTQKILGGATVSEVFDMDQDGILDIVTITSGITVWYKVSAPASCAVNAHSCTINETCTTPDPWGAPVCVCSPGFDKNNSAACIDTNECLQIPSPCSQVCNNTVGSYECSCLPGYRLLGQFTCDDIKECQENNGGCNQRCNESIGGYNCLCNPGYALDPSNNRTCVDIDECALDPNPCNAPIGGNCTNSPPGKFTCNCFTGYWQVGTTEADLNFCRAKECTWLPWEDWRNGACWVRETRDRSVNFVISGSGNINCPKEVSQEWRFNFTALCVPPRSRPGTLFAAGEFLNKALTPFYLSSIYPDPYAFGGRFEDRYALSNFSGNSSYYAVPFPLVRLGFANSNTSYSKRAIYSTDPTADTLGIFQFEAPVCNPTNLRLAAEDMRSFISYWLLLNRNGLQYKIDAIPIEGSVDDYIAAIGGGINFNYTHRNCSIILDVSGAYAFNWLPIAIGVPLGIFGLLLLLLLLLYWWRWREMKKALSILSTLPKVITVHYRNCIRHPEQWEILEHDPPLYRKLLTDMEDVNHVMGIFRKLDGNKIRVEHIYAVYNPSLVQAMALTREKFENRVVNDAALFYAEKWKEMNCTRADMKRRQWVKDTFIRRVAEFEWNHELAVPIIPTIHGTAATVAWKICHGGFATLSSLDVGFFGAGIYFTTSAKYAIPYFATKAQPAIIISYLVPGNPYPVIEDPNKPGKLAGEVIKVGYQSHYVLTTNRGMPFEKIEVKNIFDEIVVDQESQVAPAYVLLLDNKGFPALIRDFERRTCEDDPANEEFERL